MQNQNELKHQLKRKKSKNGEYQLTFPDKPFTINEMIAFHNHIPPATVRLRIQEHRNKGSIDVIGHKSQPTGRPVMYFAKTPISIDVLNNVDKNIVLSDKYTDILRKEIRFNKIKVVSTNDIKTKVEELVKN